MAKKKFTSFDIEIKESDDEKREITAIGSKEIVDRDRDVISIEGMDLKPYLKNPTFIWAHRGNETPENVLGTATKVWKDGKNLMFKLKFLEPEINGRADMVYKMYKAKALRSFSIGFMPDWSTTEYNEKRGGFDFKNSELLEISAVPVPANPAALIQTAEFKSMVDDGIIDDLELKDFEIYLKENQPKVEDRDTYTKEEMDVIIKDILKRFETHPLLEFLVEDELHPVDELLADIFDDEKSVGEPETDLLDEIME